MEGNNPMAITVAGCWELYAVGFGRLKGAATVPLDFIPRMNHSEGNALVWEMNETQVDEWRENWMFAQTPPTDLWIYLLNGELRRKEFWEDYEQYLHLPWVLPSMGNLCTATKWPIIAWPKPGVPTLHRLLVGAEHLHGPMTRPHRAGPPQNPQSHPINSASPYTPESHVPLPPISWQTQRELTVDASSM